MIDTHCHIYQEYYDDIPQLIEKFKRVGINKIIVNGCNMESNKEVLELVNKYDIVYGAIGFHPSEDINDVDEAINFLKEHVNDKKIVAIGEIGLDYHYENTDIVRQQMLFKRQLEIANKFNKPIIVHTRDAIKDTYDILSMFPLHGTIHAYSGSLEMAKQFIKLGYLLGVGGVITFKNAKNILDVVKNVSLEYIVLETDSPYLAPEPYRGKTNSPEYLNLIVCKIANIKNVDESVVIIETTENAERLFDF